MINRVVVDNASGRILFTDEVEAVEDLTAVLEGQTGMENTNLVREHTHTYIDGEFVYVGDAALRVPVLMFDALKFITLTFAASIVPVVILLPLMEVTLLTIAFCTSPAAKVVNPLGLLEAYAAISALKEAAFVILPSIKDCVTSEDESLEFAVA